MTEEIDELIAVLKDSISTTAHIGVSLQAMVLVRDYAISKDSAAGDKMYNNPFYAYFHQCSGDLHVPYPLRVNALFDALEAYKRMMSPKRVSND